MRVGLVNDGVNLNDLTDIMDTSLFNKISDDGHLDKINKRKSKLSRGKMEIKEMNPDIASSLLTPSFKLPKLPPPPLPTVDSNVIRSNQTSLYNSKHSERQAHRFKKTEI